MSQHQGIFPTFFLSGFECSTFRWKDQGRRDLVKETGHIRHLEDDYQMLRELGIDVVREGVPWPLVDQGGKYDFSRLEQIVEKLNQCQLLPIWDLCHYGYPDDLEPYSPDFQRRFVDYARAVAEYVVPRVRGPHCFTPINEMTFFGFCGGEWGWAAPYGKTRDERHRLRRALCAASIAGVQAIREVDPEARMVHVEPLIQVVAPRDRPDLIEKAHEETHDDTFYAWDVLAGKREPELGGSLETLDIVGVNCYSFGQMEYRESGPHAALEPNDDRIMPLVDLLEVAWQRYHRPMIISETSGLADGREAWLRDIMQESLAAVYRGIDLHGVCLFPAVDMPDWHTGEWLHNGISDVVEGDPELSRVLYQPLVDELRRWQKKLRRVTRVDEDPDSDPIDLADIRAAAEELQLSGDKNWH